MPQKTREKTLEKNVAEEWSQWGKRLLDLIESNRAFRRKLSASLQEEEWVTKSYLDQELVKQTQITKSYLDQELAKQSWDFDAKLARQSRDFDEKLRKGFAVQEAAFDKKLQKALADQTAAFDEKLQKGFAAQEAAFDKKLQKMFSAHMVYFDHRLQGLGGRWGKDSERVFRDGLTTLLEKELQGKILHWSHRGKLPEVALRREDFELDVVITNERVTVVEVKGTTYEEQVEKFLENALAYEAVEKRRIDRKIMVTCFATNEALALARRLQIEVIVPPPAWYEED